MTSKVKNIMRGFELCSESIECDMERVKNRAVNMGIHYCGLHLKELQESDSTGKMYRIEVGYSDNELQFSLDGRGWHELYTSKDRDLSSEIYELRKKVLYNSDQIMFDLDQKTGDKDLFYSTLYIYAVE